MPVEATGGFQCHIEICCAANILPYLQAIAAVCVVNFAGLSCIGFIHLTALIQKMSQPVIVLPVPGDGIPDHLRLINVVVLVDHTFGTFDDPGQNCTACLVIEVVSIVLDVRFSDDFSIEWNNDEPTLGASIHGTDFGQVVGIEDERMAGHIAEEVLILFLRVDFVGGTELLHIGCVQAHTFL